MGKQVDFKVFKGSKSGEIVEGTSKREIKHNQVLVKITHSGLCGTDIHYKHSDMVLGHEGIGTVEAIGNDVSQIKVGDRVGWGYEHDCCGHCKQCLRGLETFCKERQMYGESDLDEGSMGSYAVWKEDFVFKIPDGIDSEYWAPMMCGGATVFNVLRSFDVKPTDRVGVIGIGGLGHLAIQFANKMGCEVVVFSGTDSKRDEAKQLGASEFIATKGLKEIKDVEPIDHLIVTTSSQPDWPLYIPILNPTGTIFPLGLAEGDLAIPYGPVLLAGLRIQGSVIAAREIMREMLRFVAHHHIKPVIQKFPLNKDGIEQAFKTLEEGNMRYRGVLVA